MNNRSLRSSTRRGSGRSSALPRWPGLRRLGVLTLVIGMVASACSQDSSAEPTASATNVSDQSGEDSSESQRGNATIASQIVAFVAAQAPAIISAQLSDVSQLPARGEIKPRTLSLCTSPDRCLHPQLDDAVWSMPVLSIRFLADDDNDGTVDQERTNYSGSVDQLRTRIDDLETRNAWWSTEASRYHGYADDNARPSIGYEVTGELEFTTSPPLGEAKPNADGVFFPAYGSLLADAGICDWVDNRGVREVWMYTHHHGDLEPAGSQLSSEIGDISNSFRFDDMPRCANPYTLYNFNFTRDVDVMLLNRAHQIEALLRQPESSLFVDEFIGGDEPPFSSPTRCGNTHWAPNSITEFVVWEPTVATSDCASWQPGGGTQVEVSCETWFGATYGDSSCYPDGGVAFSIWWMQNLPGHENGLSDGDRRLTNWWQPMGDLEQVIANDSWLTE